MLIIGAFLVAIAAWFLPMGGKIVAAIIDAIIPEPLVGVDEIIIGVAIIKGILFAQRTWKLLLVVAVAAVACSVLHAENLISF